MRTDSRSTGEVDQSAQQQPFSRRMKQWGQGDGRYRRPTSKLLGLGWRPCAAALVVLFVLAVAAFTVWPPAFIHVLETAATPPWSMLLSLLLLIVVVGLLFAGGLILRLQRPRLEYLGFCFCVVWLAGAIFGLYLLSVLLTHPAPFNVGKAIAFLVVDVVFLLLTIFPLRHAMRCFIDQLYWSLVDYGTSAIRLPALIVAMMLISFVFVSGQKGNFEPTLLAELSGARTAAGTAQARAEDPSTGGRARADFVTSTASVPGSSRERKWDENKMPKDQYWVMGERIWMTLRYHVPLVGAIISEEWQPADRSMAFVGLTPSGGSGPPDWYRCAHCYWPRARDWYAAMLWLNWILWPLFLPFLIRVLARER